MDEVVVQDCMAKFSDFSGLDADEPTLAVKPFSNDYLELIESSLWSDRYNGYEMIINELKTSEDGFEVFKSNNVDIPSILEEPHDLATRKAYKLVSIYIRIEEDTDIIKSLYFKL